MPEVLRASEAREIHRQHNARGGSGGGEELGRLRVGVLTSVRGQAPRGPGDLRVG
jgi:hypothetical protein